MSLDQTPLENLAYLIEEALPHIPSTETRHRARQALEALEIHHRSFLDGLTKIDLVSSDQEYRQGRKVKRNVYRVEDPLFVAQSRPLARFLVRIMNAGTLAFSHPDYLKKEFGICPTASTSLPATPSTISQASSPQP